MHYYKTIEFVFCDKLSYQVLILNDLFSGGRNPGKILKFTSQSIFYVSCNDVTQTQTESGTGVLQT